VGSSGNTIESRRTGADEWSGMRACVWKKKGSREKDGGWEHSVRWVRTQSSCKAVSFGTCIGFLLFPRQIIAAMFIYDKYRPRCGIPLQLRVLLATFRQDTHIMVAQTGG
jgi:hypothetical protein